MKTTPEAYTEKQISTECVNQRTHKWAWLAGAAAASMNFLPAASAADVTVNLIGDTLTPGANNLYADLSGDGTPMITISQIQQHNSNTILGSSGIGRLDTVAVHINGVGARAVFSMIPGGTGIETATIGHVGHISTIQSQPFTATIPINFQDNLINGDALTFGYITVTATDAVGEVGIQIDSYTYETFGQSSGSVPDQTSTLALLALGAGGVLALRQRRQAA